MARMRQGMPRTSQLRRAAARGDFALAVAIACDLAPEAAADLEKFRHHMELYLRARSVHQWHRAYEELGYARSAAIAAELPALEALATHKMTELMRETNKERRT